jgi:hypothetical protein
LRMRVNMSAIGSDVFIPSSSSLNSFAYHDDFTTPGISPASASFRKQMRHKRNLLMNPRGRPQRKQRLRWRQASLGFFAAFAAANFSSFAIFAVVAMDSSLPTS